MHGKLSAGTVLAGSSNDTGSGGVQQSPVGGSPSGSTAGQVLGALNYNWVEYRMTSGAGGQQVTMYFKFDKQKGTCTMRIDGQDIPGMTGQEMSCGSTGGETQSNPNQVSPDVTLTYLGTESVTVPAGTFMASKYTSSYQGTTSTYWVAGGTPLIKVVSSGGEGSSTMELNGWG